MSRYSTYCLKCHKVNACSCGTDKHQISYNNGGGNPPKSLKNKVQWREFLRRFPWFFSGLKDDQQELARALLESIRYPILIKGQEWSRTRFTKTKKVEVKSLEEKDYPATKLLPLIEEWMKGAVIEQFSCKNNAWFEVRKPLLSINDKVREDGMVSGNFVYRVSPTCQYAVKKHIREDKVDMYLSWLSGEKISVPEWDNETLPDAVEIRNPHIYFESVLNDKLHLSLVARSEPSLKGMTGVDTTLVKALSDIGFKPQVNNKDGILEMNWMTEGFEMPEILKNIKYWDSKEKGRYTIEINVMNTGWLELFLRDSFIAKKHQILIHECLPLDSYEGQKVLASVLATNLEVDTDNAVCQLDKIAKPMCDAA